MENFEEQLRKDLHQFLLSMKEAFNGYDELIRIIEHSVEKLTLAELEALYYDMTTKSYIND